MQRGRRYVFLGVHRTYLCDNIRKGVIWSNTQGYCDPEMDKMLNAAAVETDLEKRKAIYADIQVKAQEDLALIYMPQDFSATVFNESVGNLPMGPFGSLAPWTEVYLED